MPFIGGVSRCSAEAPVRIPLRTSVSIRRHALVFEITELQFHSVSSPLIWKWENALSNCPQAPYHWRFLNTGIHCVAACPYYLTPAGPHQRRQGLLRKVVYVFVH